MLREIDTDEFDKILNHTELAEMPEAFRVVCNLEEALINHMAPEGNIFAVVKNGKPGETDLSIGLVLSDNLAFMTHYCEQAKIARLALFSPSKTRPDSDLDVVLKIYPDGSPECFKPDEEILNPEITKAYMFIKEYINPTA